MMHRFVRPAAVFVMLLALGACKDKAPQTPVADEVKPQVKEPAQAPPAAPKPVALQQHT